MIETRKQNFLYKSVKEIELICKGVNQIGLLKDTSLREKDRERGGKEKKNSNSSGNWTHDAWDWGICSTAVP